MVFLHHPRDWDFSCLRDWITDSLDKQTQQRSRIYAKV